MRYLYKINSKFDGFTPARIPDRMTDGRYLSLGWAKYLDAIRLGDEVWVIFIGGNFIRGVYLRGLVSQIDADAGQVILRVQKYDQRTPLTDVATSAALLDVVDVRYRQVFVWPADRLAHGQCSVDRCENRGCLTCDVWTGLPEIDPLHYHVPASLRGTTVVPAFWVIPPRCFLYYGARSPASWIKRITNMFSAFKIGEKRYAFPLAAGIDAALKSRGLDSFDAVVSIPLSPEKAANGELDRTDALATELARLIGAPKRSYLSLSGPISKRRMIAQGYTASQFKQRYQELLQVDPGFKQLQRIILVDDVITRGSTLSVAVAKIKTLHPDIDIVVAAAGQMVVKDAVADMNGPAW